MAKSINDCPYLKATSKGQEVQIVIREDYELQYNKDHIVEKVKVGETDIVKEVESHIGEAGLLNAIKNAIAHGEDPQVVYAKTEPGMPVSVPNNATLDDLLELSNQNKAKYAEIAKSLGVTVAQLKAAVANGTIGSIIEQKSKEPDKEKEGNE